MPQTPPLPANSNNSQNPQPPKKMSESVHGQKMYRIVIGISSWIQQNQYFQTLMQFINI